jgi:hypothetical protein
MLWYVGRAYHDRLVALFPPPPTSSSATDSPPASTAEPAQSSLPLDLSPRVLQGLESLGAFLIHQSRRLTKPAAGSADADEFSSEQRRVARENVPWDVVPDPTKLARDLYVLARRALGRRGPEDYSELPPDPTKLRPTATAATATAAATASSGKKRKASTSSGSEARKPKFRNFNKARSLEVVVPISPRAPRSASVLSSPSSATTKVERGVPKLKTDVRTDVVEGRLAEVRTTTSETETVTRKVCGVSKDGEEGGGEDEEEEEVRETRRVVTVVERVVWRRKKGGGAGGVGGGEMEEVVLKEESVPVQDGLGVKEESVEGAAIAIDSGGG